MLHITYKKTIGFLLFLTILNLPVFANHHDSENHDSTELSHSNKVTKDSEQCGQICVWIVWEKEQSICSAISQETALFTCQI